MKKILIFVFVLFNFLLNAQTLDDKLNDLTSKMAKDLNKQGTIQIAVYPFSYLKPNEKNLAFDVRFDVHDKLMEKGKTYRVMDRGTFDTYALEHKLNAEGLIDETTAKKFGKLIAADAYVTGQIYMFGSVIRIRVKVTHTETGEILSMQSENLPVDYDMALFLGLENWKEKREEAEENKSQNPNCAIDNVGDYCFYNNSNDTYEVRLKNSLGGGFYGESSKLVLSPNSKSCFKDLKSGSYSYSIVKNAGMNGPATVYKTEYSGEFTIKKCEARMQNIRKDVTYNIVKQNTISNEKLVTISIKNPNNVSREVLFINRSGEEIPVIVGPETSTLAEIPVGYYKMLSKTTFTKVVVEQAVFMLNSNKIINLAKDYKN